jgi:photosystem II stability/assembly factor-like uncharacterized protein
VKFSRSMVLPIVVGLFLIMSGCTGKTAEKQAGKPVKFNLVQAKSVKFKQIRGIGFPGNDNGLYIATEKGLLINQNKQWLRSTTSQNDYIGFQAVENGFAASGHPQKGIGLKDPLGIVQSGNKGKTLSKIAFYGNKNFHFIAESFSGTGLYIINEVKDDNMNPGVYYSKDNGKSWDPSALKDFTADSLGMMAVHPEDGNIMAMSTRSGIFYSTDNGNTMKLITKPVMATALTFFGDSILYSSVEDETILLKVIYPKNGAEAALSTPFLSYENPITYLAVNPKNQQEIAFSTYKNDVYESTDGGKNWSLLISQGKKEQD